MLAKVNQIFLDAQANRLRRAGEVMEVSAERFAELNGSIPGVVSEVEGAPAEQAAAEAATPEPAQAGGDGAAIDEMTCAQLRELIESKGGQAPAKAKRAELAEIAQAL